MKFPLPIIKLNRVNTNFPVQALQWKIQRVLRNLIYLPQKSWLPLERRFGRWGHGFDGYDGFGGFHGRFDGKNLTDSADSRIA